MSIFLSFLYMIAQYKRNLLAETLLDKSLIIISWGRQVLRNGDVFYPFRQKSDFLLLTELHAPDLDLIGYKSWPETKWILYSDPITDAEILWWSSRLPYEDLSAISGISDIRPHASFEKDRSLYCSDARQVYTSGDQWNLPDEKHFSLSSLLTPLRMKKTTEEIEKMKRAIESTAEAYFILRSIIKPWMYEYEVEAEIARVFRRSHMTEAYPTIVASWPNSCILHYDRHTRKIQNNDHILIDFWAEYDGYAADITRVFFLWEQDEKKKALYDDLLEVKRYALSAIRPGISRLQYERDIRRVMNEFLKSYGYMRNWLSQEEEERVSRIYYPHSTSHFLGLDPHDTGDRDQIFEPDMVITCEPGIYIREEGIGYRHEDDILITSNGRIVLSERIPM